MCKVNRYFLCFLLATIVKLPVFIMGFLGINTPIVAGDPYVHMLISYYPLGWNSFNGVFPFGSIIWLKIFNQNISLIVCFQFLLSSLAWAFPIYFAFEVKGSKFKRNMLVISLLCFISSIGITSWDNQIGSDSLTLSYLVIATSLLFIIYVNEHSNTIVKVLFIISLIFLIITRDSNNLVAIFLVCLLLLCRNVDVSYKILTISVSALVIGLMLYSAKPIRSSVHYSDILAVYIINNDTPIESNMDYYAWYMKNTKMPDIQHDYNNCSSFSSTMAMLKKLPHYPFNNSDRVSEISAIEANNISALFTAKGCLPFYNESFNNYFYSDSLSRDYIRFLLDHPKFIFFASGKYLFVSKMMLLSPSKVTNYSKNTTLLSKIANDHKILFYLLIHGLFIIFELVIIVNILQSGYRVFLIWLVAFYLPMLLFTWLCFIAEPLELHRHLLAGLWYQIVGGFYLILYVDKDKLKANKK